MYSRKKINDLKNKSSLESIVRSENSRKLKEVSPAIILASLIFVSLRLYLNKEYSVISDPLSLSIISFLLIIILSYFFLLKSVNSVSYPLYIFISGFLLFGGFLGGYNYKMTGDITIFAGGILFLLSVFNLTKIKALILIFLETLIFLLTVFYLSESISQIIFALKGILPFLVLFLLFSFINSDIRKRMFNKGVEFESKEKLDVLYKISNAVNTTDNLSDLIRNIHSILSSVIDVKNFFVAINEREGLACPFFIDEYDDYKDVFESIKKEDKFSIAGYVIKNRKMVILNKKEMVRLAEDHGDKITGRLSEIYIGIPLKIRDIAIGAIAIQDYNDKKAYSERDIKLLKSVSEQIALAIEIKRCNDKLIESEKMYRIILESSKDVIIKADSKLDLTYVSPSGEKLSGYPLEELYKMNLSDFFDPSEKEKLKDSLFSYLLKKQETYGSEFQKKINFRIFLNGKPGKWVELSYRVLRDEKGEMQLIAFINDISARKEYEMNLIYQVNHDNLTGLYNRKALIDELEKTIKYAKRYNEKRVILFIDIDNFKLVNDTYGHAKGDIILKKVADRLKGSLRESDFVARLGGDEFTVILNNPNEEDKDIVIKKIQERLSDNYYMDGIKIDYISASIGVSIYPDNGTDHESLIFYADKEMYRDKDTKI